MLREVADGVLVATSRTDTTNSVVVVGEGRECLLVDPAWQPFELAAIADDLDARGLVPVAGFSTHAHHDHLLWHPRFGDVSRWASPETVRLAVAERPALVEALGAGWPHDLVEAMGLVEPLDDDRVPWNGPEATLVVHDAHVPGHTALWLPASRVLVAGDMLSDVELPLPDESSWSPDPLGAYLDGLDRIAPFVAEAEVVVPGHGETASGSASAARLTADRRYLSRLLAGLPVDDPRVGNEGMPAAHAVAEALATRRRSTSPRST